MKAALVKSFALLALVAAAGVQNAPAAPGIPGPPTVSCSLANDGDLYTINTHTREGDVAWTYQCVADQSGGGWQLIMRCDEESCVMY